MSTKLWNHSRETIFCVKETKDKLTSDTSRSMSKRRRDSETFFLLVFEISSKGRHVPRNVHKTNKS